MWARQVSLLGILIIKLNSFITQKWHNLTVWQCSVITLLATNMIWLPRQKKKKRQKCTQVSSELFTQSFRWSWHTTSKLWDTCKHFLPLVGSIENTVLPSTQLSLWFTWSWLGPCKVFALRAEWNINHCGLWLLATSLSVSSAKK